MTGYRVCYGVCVCAYVCVRCVHLFVHEGFVHVLVVLFREIQQPVHHLREKGMRGRRCMKQWWVIERRGGREGGRECVREIQQPVHHLDGW